MFPGRELRVFSRKKKMFIGGWQRGIGEGQFRVKFVLHDCILRLGFGNFECERTPPSLGQEHRVLIREGNGER